MDEARCMPMPVATSTKVSQCQETVPQSLHQIFGQGSGKKWSLCLTKRRTVAEAEEVIGQVMLSARGGKGCLEPGTDVRFEMHV